MAGVAGSQPQNLDAPIPQAPVPHAAQLNIPVANENVQMPAQTQEPDFESLMQAHAQAADSELDTMMKQHLKKKEPGLWEEHIRPVVKGALEGLPAAGAMAGGVLGGLSTGIPTMGMGAPGGAMVGAAAGGALGKAAQNFGEQLMGDSKTYGQLAMGPVEGAVEGLTQEAGGQITGKVLSTVLPKMLPSQAALHEADAAVQRFNRLKEAGVDLPNLTPMQAAPNSNVAKSLSSTVAGRQAYQEQMRETAGSFKKALTKLNSLAGDIGGASQPGLGSNVVSKASSLDSAEWSVIQEIQGKAEQLAAGQTQKAPKVKEALGAMASKYGSGIDKAGNANFITPANLADVGITDEGKAKLISNLFNSKSKQLMSSGGELTYQQMLNNYNHVKQVIGNNLRNPEVIEALTPLRNAYRDQIAETSGELIKASGDPKAIDAYKKSWNRFVNVKQAFDTLGGALGDESIATKELTKKIMNSGSAAEFDAMQSLIGGEHPELWNKLKGAHLQGMAEAATDAKTGDINFEKLRTQFTKMDPQIVQRMWGENGPKLWDDFLTSAVRAQAEIKASANAAPSDGMTAKLLLTAGKLFHGDLHSAGQALASIKGLGDYFERTNAQQLASGALQSKGSHFTNLKNAAIDVLTKSKAGVMAQKLTPLIEPGQ